MSRLFRTQLMLMLFGHWGFGCHVADPTAFSMRLSRVRWQIRM